MSDEHIEIPEYHQSHIPGCTTKCSKSTGFVPSNSCSYRHNGYLQMKDKQCPHLPQANRTLYEVDFTQGENAVRLLKLFPEYDHGATNNPEKGKGRDTTKWIGDEPNWKNWRYAKNPLTDKEAWWFTKPDNYKSDYLPFGVNYHHIVPAEAVSRVYDNAEQIVLQLAEYNINDGKNMIILPKLDAYAYALLMHSHYTDHKLYTSKVIDKLKSLRSQLITLMEKHKLKKDEGKLAKKNLENWQQLQFKKIVDHGKQYALQAIKDLETDVDAYGYNLDSTKRNTINQAPAVAAKAIV